MVWSRSWAASRAAAVGAQPDTDVQDTDRVGRNRRVEIGALVTNTRKRPCLWGGLPRISPECAGDGTLAAKPEPGAIVIAEPRSWREIRRRLGTSYATRLGGHRSVLACQPLRGSTQRLLFRVNVLTAVGRPRSTNCGAPISMLLAGGAKRSGGPDGGSCAVTNLTGRRATWWPGEAGWRGAAATSQISKVQPRRMVGDWAEQLRRRSFKAGGAEPEGRRSWRARGGRRTGLARTRSGHIRRNF
jgi:hypothetical protein